MWDNALCGTAKFNFEDIEYFQYKKSIQPSFEKDICMFVVEGINALPWYFRLPLKIYSVFINLFCLIITGRLLANTSTKKRKIIMQWIKIIPLFGLYNKIVRVKVFIILFDDLPQDKKNIIR